MKKIVAAILSLCLVLLLFSCGAPSAQTDEPATHVSEGEPLYISDYDAGYSDGLEDAWADAPALTIDDIPQSIYDEIYEIGYESGLEDAGSESSVAQLKADAFSEGYAEGLADGRAQGYDEGYDAGYEAGRKDGYSSGYDDGKKVAALNNKYRSGAPEQNTPPTSATTPVEQTVYITKSGSKCHRGGCQYLQNSQIAISLSDAIARGYTACSKCW